MGCGSSSGVPAIGNEWGNCNPKNPKNRRLRSSILIKINNQIILVDATPDLRQQLLNANVRHLDAILIRDLTLPPTLQNAIEKKTGQQADPIRQRTPSGTWVTDVSQSRSLDASFKDLTNLATAD